MTMINIHEAKTHLSRYLRQVRAGERVILCERNRPVAEIRALSAGEAERVLPGSHPARELGRMAGCVTGMEDFFDADEEIAADFAGDTDPDPRPT